MAAAWAANELGFIWLFVLGVIGGIVSYIVRELDL
jgi:hypothetical protein